MNTITVADRRILSAHRIDYEIRQSIRRHSAGATVREIVDYINRHAVDAMQRDVIKRHLRSLHAIGELTRTRTTRDGRPVDVWRLA